MPADDRPHIEIFSAVDAPVIFRNGIEHVRMPHSVWLLQQVGRFAVLTARGTMTAMAGDYLAYDPITGDVWPISRDHVLAHYRPTRG